MGGGQKRRRSQRWWKGSGICKQARRKEWQGEEKCADDDEVWDEEEEKGERLQEGIFGAGASSHAEEPDAEHAQEHTDSEEMTVFERHARLQSLCETEEEWDAFMDSLRQPLPVTIRVNRGLYSKEVVDACLKAGEQFLRPPSADSVCHAEYLPWTDTYKLSVHRRELKTIMCVLNAHHTRPGWRAV
jgi:hypothetical protein